MELIDKELTSRKAREILRHGSVHGHALTAKQKRYFGWVAGGGSGYGDDDFDETGEAGFIEESFVSSSGSAAAADDYYYGGDTAQARVVMLLNRRTKKDSREALDLLCKLYGVDEHVGLEFSGCEEKPVSPVYPPFRTGYANSVRIHICSDSLGDAFNAIRSKQIHYDPALVTHYCAVFLHEFAHVLDKRKLLPAEFYGYAKNDIERRADRWAQHFIDEYQKEKGKK